MEGEWASTWTRIGIFLPTNNDPERVAFEQLIAFAKQLFPGLTYSHVQRPAFVGWWKNSRTGAWVPDKIAWLLIDVPYAVNTIWVEAWARLLQLKALDLYAAQNRPQDAVYVSAHSLSMRT